MMTRPAALRTSRHLAAYHEAGHAVASFFRPLAGATTWVTVRDADLDEGDAGACYSEGRPGRPAHCADSTDPRDPAAAADSTDPRDPAAAADSAGPSDAARALAVVALAGPEVDRHLTGNALTSGSDDYEVVRDLLFRAFLDAEIEELVASVEPEEARARGLDAIADDAAAEVEDHLKGLVEELRTEAHQLVESKWHHVEAVAKALLEKETLDGHQVREIIEVGEGRPRPA